MGSDEVVAAVGLNVGMLLSHQHVSSVNMATKSSTAPSNVSCSTLQTSSAISNTSRISCSPTPGVHPLGTPSSLTWRKRREGASSVASIILKTMSEKVDTRQESKLMPVPTQRFTCSRVRRTQLGGSEPLEHLEECWYMDRECDML